MRLEKETADKEQPDIASLRTESETASSESNNISEKRDEINGRLNKTESALKELSRVAILFEKSEKTKVQKLNPGGNMFNVSPS
jgi:hypothetical protein